MGRILASERAWNNCLSLLVVQKNLVLAEFNIVKVDRCVAFEELWALVG